MRHTETEVLERRFPAPSTVMKGWRDIFPSSSAEEQPALVMRHNSKRPTEYYRYFSQMPTTLLLFLEIKLLRMGLASHKWAQPKLCCYCQQYVLYLSQASEYYKAARFSSQHIHDGLRCAIPNPWSGSAKNSRSSAHRVMRLRMGRTGHVWPQTPKTLLVQEALFVEADGRWSWGQTSKSAVKWCLLGEG